MSVIEPVGWQSSAGRGRSSLVLFDRFLAKCGIPQEGRMFGKERKKKALEKGLQEKRGFRPVVSSINTRGLGRLSRDGRPAQPWQGPCSMKRLFMSPPFPTVLIQRENVLFTTHERSFFVPGASFVG